VASERLKKTTKINNKEVTMKRISSRSILTAIICSALLIIFAGVAPITGASGVRAISPSEPVEGQVEQEVEQEARLDNLLVTITGLKEGDVATVTLLPESAPEDSEPILENTVTSKGTESSVIDMSYPLKDGYYQLNITAPDEYFREPKAWLFMVSDSQLVNPLGKSVVFKLVPPEDQKFQPFRGSMIQTSVDSNPEPPSEPPSIMMEWMQSLSAPAKQPIEENTIDSTGYHHFGWRK